MTPRKHTAKKTNGKERMGEGALEGERPNDLPKG